MSHVNPLAGSALLVRGLPQTGFSRFKHSISYQISSVRVSKCWRGPFATQSNDEIGGLMHKTFRITDPKAWHPPIAHVRVFAVGDMNLAPTARRSLIPVIEILQSVQVVQVPFQ